MLVSSISFLLPIKTVLCPLILAFIPLPVIASKCSNADSLSPSASAFLIIASASGCSEPFSTLAARANTSFSLYPSAGIISVTSGCPLVIVPVLSKTITLTSLRVCMASPRLIRMPFSAPIPLPTMSTVGVANPRAQGQAITSVATIANIASETTPSVGSTHGRN